MISPLVVLKQRLVDVHTHLVHVSVFGQMHLDFAWSLLAWLVAWSLLAWLAAL